MAFVILNKFVFDKQTFLKNSFQKRRKAGKCTNVYLGGKLRIKLVIKLEAKKMRKFEIGFFPLQNGKNS